LTEARRRPGPRRAVTESDMLDAARALLDAGGPDAASIRRIAAAMSVPPNAVYTYFPDQAAVAHALVERLLGQVDRAAARSGATGWRRRIEALAVQLRSRLAAHPGLVPLLFGGRMDGPHAGALREKLLALLAEGGLADCEAARGAHAIVVYVLGAVAMEASDAPHVGALPPELERIAARRVAYAAAGDAFPRTAAAADVIAAWIGTDQFVWGLRRLIDGLAGPELP
jgi:TetR/AcrR family transcriptional regulator, tetracycline repressor protein